MKKDDIEVIVAGYLLTEKAVKLNPEEPFTWASGWKSPIYCDNRILVSNPEIRTKIAHFFSRMISKQYPDVEVIAGVSTSGIPWATLIADILNLPLIYIRAESKDHGRKNLIEGNLIPEQKVVVIEDLISTGGSSLKVCDNVSSEGGNVLGLVGIFQYGFPTATEKFKEIGISFDTLTNYETLLNVATKQNYISENDMETLQKWSQDPGNWRNDLKTK